jgi:hypothetical protein
VRMQAEFGRRLQLAVRHGVFDITSFQVPMSWETVGADVCAKEVAARTSIGITAFMNPPFLKIAIVDDFDYRLPSKGPLRIKFANCARVKLQSSGTVQESRFARPAAQPTGSRSALQPCR